MNQLDKSWYEEEFGDRAEEAFENKIQCDYIQGASDFQKQAIKKLEEQLSYSTGRASIEQSGLSVAIEIIKQLKAE